jgi:hypothetical protein
MKDNLSNPVNKTKTNLENVVAIFPYRLDTVTTDKRVWYSTKMCDEYPRMVDYDNVMLVNIFFCSETQVRSETNSLSTLP